MVIKNIFELVDEALYAVLYDGFDVHEVTRAFDQWTDITYLSDFFDEHEEDLNDPFFDGVSKYDAIRQTRNEAKKFRDVLYNYAKGVGGDLSDFFHPLSDGDLLASGYERDKAYGPFSPSWLRLYALRINRNVFVVTGSAIKLSPKMDRPHLETELNKLNHVKRHLQEEDNDDSAKFYELSL